ncbi:RHS repeat-associated core domain-containing protein [Candidatus Thiosymbion oneisti]|uniref:RHS repeat-associated core domain-containing protein n=1 Tax=Candidatus Thiosymbion oneisti TaxID=589554 RepID=UPI000AFC7C2E|nr:RHS repeat-associated core domain-containing protein [Candidatus Thiosymbion oneisti]
MTQIGEGVHATTGTASNCECTATGHPIDVATGRVFVVDKDITFTYPLSIGLFRTWSSSHAGRPGLFGSGWTSFLDLRLVLDPDELIYYDDEGRAISLPLIAVGDSFYLAAEGLTLLRLEDHFELTQRNGRSYRFTPDGRLQRVQSGHYHSIDLLYQGVTVQPPPRHSDWDAGIQAPRMGTRHGKLRGAERLHQGEQLIGLKDAGSKDYRLVYDDLGRLTAIYCHIQSAQQEIRLRGYTYDNRNRLTAVHDEFANPLQYTYDDNDLLIAEINRNGYCFNYEYDAQGRCIKNWGDQGEYYRELRYTTGQGKTEVIDSLQQKTTYYWNRQGLVVMVVDAASGVHQYHYDRNRRLIGEIDANQNTITYEYDEQGRQTAKTDQENNRWETVYDDDKPDVHIDPLGNEIIRIHDQDDNLIQEEDSQGNRQTHQTAAGKSTQENHPAVRKEYDEWHRLLSMGDAEGHTRHFVYDLKGRLIRERDKNGNETSYGYDAEDNLIWTRDPLGNEKRFIYRGLNKLSEQRDENGNTVKFEYDSEGQLTTITNENNEKHTFSYDACGRLSSDIGFGGETNTYGYDRKGNIVTVSRPGGSLDIRYDKTGRIVEIAGHDPAGTHCRNTYQYDQAGRLIEASNEHSTVRFEYDALGRIIKEQQGEQSIERVYDAAGNLIARKGPWDTSIEFEYDENDNLVGVTLPGDKIIRLLLNDQGQPVERQLPGGSYSHCKHDPENRLLSQKIHDPSSDLLTERKYSYDQNKRVIVIEDNKRGTKRYAYDPSGRLIRESQDKAQDTEDFIYDAAGNLLQRGHHQAQYASGNRLLSSTHGAAGFDYTHDARGNIATRRGENGITQLQYNSFNQLIGCFDLAAGCDLNYFYDALGRRIGKKAFDGTEVTYYWDQLQLIAEEPERKNKTIYIFKPETSIPLAILQNGTAYFCHTDHLGTPLEITDEAGKLVWQGNYDAFGACEEKVAIIPNLLRFPGQQFDRESGLHYNVFRYYDPRISRYITQDSISYLSKDFNLYRYARGAPVYRTDPFGLAPIAIPVAEVLIPAIVKGLAWVTGIVLAAVGAKEAADEISKSKSKSKEEEKCEEGNKGKKRRKTKEEKEQQLKDMKKNPPDHPDYEPPKNWNGKKVKNPNGSGSGWPDKKGRVWQPTDHKGKAHGPHWDVQSPGGGYTNIYPLD